MYKVAMPVEWVGSHKFVLGILADALTFLGAAALARDAFRRMLDLRESRIDAAFRKEYGSLHLSDEEMKAAIISLRWTFVGFFMMCAGFACQLALRFAE